MKATCRYTGIEFSTQFFPYTFSNSTQHHPIFDIPFADLLSISRTWNTGKLTEIDKRLYFVALLKSTELCEFRTYARPSDRIIAANMDGMIEWAGLIHGIKTRDAFNCLPHFVISHQTASLENIDGWFDTWADAMEEYKDQYRTYNANQLQLRREQTLERLIKDSSRTTESYANLLGEWACIAASFPTGLVPNPFRSGESISLAEYWKDLFRKCGSNTFQLWKLDLTDLNDLLEHLELNLPHGSITAHEVLVLIRSAITRYNNVLGTNNILATPYTILNESDGVERANLLAGAAKAPTIEPRLEDYPSKVAYLRAKARWVMKEMVDEAEAEKQKRAARTITSTKQINIEEL